MAVQIPKSPSDLPVSELRWIGRAVKRDAVVQGGRALQPMLYALAAEKLFADKTVHSGRLSYCTAAGAFEQRDVELNDGTRGAGDTATNAVLNRLDCVPTVRQLRDSTGNGWQLGCLLV